jgi:bla regulator protein blaR1
VAGALLASAAALARAFPAIPLLARAAAELAVLAEMTADDDARHHNPADLAAALVTLATTGSRTTALTAGDPAAIARIHRPATRHRGMRHHRHGLAT